MFGRKNDGSPPPPFSRKLLAFGTQTCYNSCIPQKGPNMNVKQVSASLALPFNWLEDHDQTSTTNHKIAWITNILYSPATSLLTRYTHLYYHDNPEGGATSFYELEITGVSSLSFRALKELIVTIRDIARSVHPEATIIHASCMDVEDLHDIYNRRWEDLV